MAVCSSRERAVDFAEEWITDLRTCEADEGWYIEEAELNVLAPLT